jgi:hypothetical protein
MKNNKPTYQELESKIDFYEGELLISKILLAVIIILGICFSLYYLFSVDYNQQLKSQLNITEGKNYSCDFVGAIKPEDTRVCEDEIIEEPKEKEVDYHSSGELFCEHYNGEYDWYKKRCIFLKEGEIGYCDLSFVNLNYFNTKFFWKEPCEAIQ